MLSIWPNGSIFKYFGMQIVHFDLFYLKWAEKNVRFPQRHSDSASDASAMADNCLDRSPLVNAAQRTLADNVVGHLLRRSGRATTSGLNFRFVSHPAANPDGEVNLRCDQIDVDNGGMAGPRHVRPQLTSWTGVWRRLFAVAAVTGQRVLPYGRVKKLRTRRRRSKCVSSSAICLPARLDFDPLPFLYYC